MAAAASARLHARPRIRACLYGGPRALGYAAGVSTVRSERDLQRWAQSLDSELLDALETMPYATLAPRRGRGSRSLAFLERLAARGQPIELRTGRVLGEGGMGQVREAEQVALGRTVAVKTLKPGQTDAAVAEGLLLEAWVMGALEHPNIVPVHHLAVDDAGMPLLILKRIEGVEWSALIANGPQLQHRFGVTDALGWNLGILNQVLNALRFAHSRGIIHRDVKPSNVMIGHFGEVYLLDWGIAVSLEPDETGRFRLAAEATEMVGTPGYMAPEMLGSDAVDAVLSERTDVYLAGAVLYELLAGHPPHVGHNALGLLQSIALSQPELPRDTPPELAQICLRAMQADPADRFPSIGALQRALADYLEHRGSERIAMRATVRLAELRACLDDVRAEPAQRREAVYRHFAICRFAFHEALAAWHGNLDARKGLERATVAVARYELGAGDPHAAVTLLRELDAPTDDAATLLAEARAAVAAQAAEQEALEQLRREQDPRTGSHRRWLFGGLLGLAYTVLPLADAAAPERIATRSTARQLAWAALMCIVIGIIGLWWRRFPTTALNRRVFAIAGLLFFAQGILVLGTWSLGLSPMQARILMLLLWGVIVGVSAITVDRWLVVSAVAYGAGFLVAARHPASTHYLMSATNLVFAVNVLWRWRPRASP